MAVSGILFYYVLSLIVVSIISTMAALYVWLRRSHRSAGLLLLAGVVWALGMALGIWSTDLAAKLLWYKVQYIGITVVPTGWLFYTLQYLGREKWFARRTLSLLCVVPTATLLLVFTNEIHGIVFGSVELSASSPFLVLRPGLWFWIFVTYSYQQLLLAAALALKTLMREPRLFRRQAFALLFTVTCPLLASIAVPLGFDLLPSLTPLVYLTAGIILVLLNPMRLRIGDILPVAHDVVVRGMTDPVIVLDDQNRILSLNPAARDLIGCSGLDISGKSIEQVWVAWRELACFRPDELKGGREITLNTGGERRTFDAKISHLDNDDRSNKSIRVIVMRDSTERRQAQGKLEYSLSLLRATIESTADGIFTVDRKRRVTNYNRRFVEMFGIPQVVLDSHVDHNVVAFVQRRMKDPRDFNRTTEELFENPELDRSDILELKDGRIFERYSKPHLVGGETVGRVVSFRDVTERVRMEKALQDQAAHLQELVEEKTKELVRSQQLLETTLESAPDFVYMKDKDTKYIYVNNSYCQFFGKTREQILGKTAYELHPKEQADIFTQEDRYVFEKGSSVISPDLAITDVKGQVHTVNAIKTPVKDAEGNVTHLIGITRDITDRKRMEGIKDRFIAAVTHEMRTPLVSIKGYLEYVLSGELGQVADKIVPNLGIVKRNTDLLLQITNDLLDVRRIESGNLPLNPEPLDFRDVMRNCIEEIQPFIQNRKQDLHVESPDGSLPVRGDSSRLSQVVLNLLTNASKFTPEGGRISLLAKGNADAIEVQISDTGIGIKKEDLGRIWEPFATVEKPSHIKGTGLGLSVAKGLTELHHGKIWAESPGEGKGATFKITLPRIEVVEVAQ